MATRPILTDGHGYRYKPDEVRVIQEALNRWRKKYLADKTPLIVDGVPGHHTFTAILGVKWALGYGKDRKATWTHALVWRMRHPHSRKYSTARMLATGARRRAAHRAAVKLTDAAAWALPGVTTFDGVPVAKCAVPFLQYARAHGWTGRLVSGWRSIPHSIALCFAMCHAAFCPGRCAGASTNHVGISLLRFAIDVSDYYNFGRIIRGFSFKGVHIFNALGARDPVHFSPTGR